ncbi:hypothetical protein DV736_g2498, partial [Chaetothyriales sp. CBS 134916]
MDSTGIDKLDALERPETPPQSTTTKSSLVSAFFARGPTHTSRSSTSTTSLTSSPLPRDSFDLYASRLGRVTEEPPEKGDIDGYTLVDCGCVSENGASYDQFFHCDRLHDFPGKASLEVYSLGEQLSSSVAPTSRTQAKRLRSDDHTPSTISNRLSRVSSSLQRRWRNRTGPGPQLSVITHIVAAGPRSESVASSRVVSPASSAISRYENGLPPSPVAASLAEALRVSTTDIHQSPHHEPDEPLQATTPLLPPAFSDLALAGSPLYDSPVQSPSIAPTQPFLNCPRHIESSTVTSLPSPPLSNKPSVVSMRQGSRTNTGATVANADIPPLCLIDEVNDPWAQSLGHANFSIHPEPYFPEHVDLESYQEFRANWDQARTNYTKHLARTIEHNGATSKVSKLTKEKWAAIDTKWKDYNESLTITLSPVLKKLSNSDSDMPDSQASTVLEKPPSHIVIPAIHDKGGKFPELGDSDIVGPMAVAPAKSPDLTTPPTTPTSPRRRHLLKFFTDMLKGT